MNQANLRSNDFRERKAHLKMLKKTMMLALCQKDDCIVNKDVVNLSWNPKMQVKFRQWDSDPCYPKINE